MKDYYEKIGQTISQFHTLEFVLRNFLFLHSNAQNINLPLPVDLYNLSIQDETVETEFTNYDSLSKLIENANNILNTIGENPIDPSLVGIRDCLAHGRVARVGNSDNKILLKFTIPKGGKVRLSHRLELTEGWFNVINKEISDCIRTLDKLSSSRTPPRFSP